MQMSHLASTALFALLISVAFAALGQRNIANRLRCAALYFLALMLVAIGVGWLLFPLSR